MNVLIADRGMGKTTYLIELSSRTKIPIVCRYPDFVVMKARKMNLDIPDPISFYNCIVGRRREIKDCYIDDIDDFLKHVCGFNAQCATLSPCTPVTIKTEINNQFGKMMDDISAGFQRIKDEICS